MCIGATMLLLAALAPAKEPGARERAVAAARAGQPEQAVAELQKLLALGHDDATLADLIVILTWAGRNDQALRLYEQGDTALTAPEYVQDAIARTYRDRRAYAEAERIALRMLERAPEDRKWLLLLALLEADQGRAAPAVKRLQTLLEKNPDDAGLWLALGYAAQRNNEPFLALRAYGQARQRQPESVEAVAAMAQILRQLRAPHGAAALLGRQPLSLQAEQAAGMLRWAGSAEPLPGTSRHADTDAAIRRIETLVTSAAAANPPDRTLLTTLERDRVVALRQRQRWGDGLAGAEALRLQGDSLPAYVRIAEADALLALQQPLAARRAYAEILAADPKNREARLGLFYAEIENENFAEAFRMADAMAAEEQAARLSATSGQPRANEDWLGAQILAANARHYADMNDDAWLRLLPLAQGAPALGYLRAALGSIAAARGWPRRAEEEIRIATTLAPEDLGNQIALADSDLRLRDAESARQRAARLVADQPDDRAVQRLIRDLRLHESHEFRLDVSGRREYGSALSSPGGGSQWTARWRTAPLAPRWRAVAAAERYTATPVEGRVERERQGAGAEYSGRDLDLELLAWRNAGTLDKPGASAIGNWRANDHFTVYAGAEAYAIDIPLRAQFYGISGNAVDLGAEYRWHESRALAGALRQVEFSDGNRRESARLVLRQRLIDRPHFDLDLRPEYYTSRNSRRGAPYFNPESDSAMTVAVEAEHVMSRHYERSWVQRLVLAAGSYRQGGFPSRTIGTLGYEQRYRLDASLELRYGLEMTRRAYDGIAERALVGSLGLVKRF